MKAHQLELDKEFAPLTRTLKAMRAHEKIPASKKRAATRARLVDEIQLTVFETRIGWLGAAFSQRGLAALHLPRVNRAQAIDALRQEFPNAVVADRAPVEIEHELREYVEGHRRRFDVSLDWSLMKPFQRTVLETANKIPFGETRTYAWIAKQVGKPQASRAVGRALATNPIPIILPCHRVLGSDGGLHGYAGGLPMKAMLLRLEGVAVNDALGA